MIANLDKIRQRIIDWCGRRNISHITVCDESDLQGIVLLQRDVEVIDRLLEFIEPVLEAENAYLEVSKVRGGTVVTLSTKAISESQLSQVIAATNEASNMSLRHKLDNVFNSQIQPEPPTVAEETKPFDIAEAAKRLAKDDREIGVLEYSMACNRNLDTWVPAVRRTGREYAVEKPFKSSNGTVMLYCYNPALNEHAYMNVGTNTIMTAEEADHAMAYSRLGKALNEALDGMATPTGEQPNDLFEKFAKALQVLGQQLGIGPVQDHLKRQGINWQKSGDGQHIVLYVKNATTGANQPIASISADTLMKPSDFETQLTNIMDFAQGNAPGTSKQQAETLKNRENAVREIAKAVGPQDEQSVQQQFQQPGMAGMAGPSAPPGTPAPQAAAAQAAAPKPQAAQPQRPQPGATGGPQKPQGQPQRPQPQRPQQV